MRLRLRRTLAVVVALPLLGSACRSATEPAYSLDCSTLAIELGTATGLITTPSGLQYRDVIVGSGAAIVSNTRVGTHYAACTTSGVVFSEVPSPSLFVFTVGQNQVFPGLDEGVQGMKLGGRRQLVIPAALGYGTAGSTGGFPVPNATIVMTIDAVTTR